LQASSTRVRVARSAGLVEAAPGRLNGMTTYVATGSLPGFSAAAHSAVP
jgi:hypothetical protein